MKPWQTQSILTFIFFMFALYFAINGKLLAVIVSFSLGLIFAYSSHNHREDES